MFSSIRPTSPVRTAVEPHCWRIGTGDPSEWRLTDASLVINGRHIYLHRSVVSSEYGSHSLADAFAAGAVAGAGARVRPTFDVTSLHPRACIDIDAVRIALDWMYGESHSRSATLTSAVEEHSNGLSVFVLSEKLGMDKLFHAMLGLFNELVPTWDPSNLVVALRESLQLCFAKEGEVQRTTHTPIEEEIRKQLAMKLAESSLDVLVRLPIPAIVDIVQRHEASPASNAIVISSRVAAVIVDRTRALDNLFLFLFDPRGSKRGEIKNALNKRIFSFLAQGALVGDVGHSNFMRMTRQLGNDGAAAAPDAHLRSQDAVAMLFAADTFGAGGGDDLAGVRTTCIATIAANYGSVDVKKLHTLSCETNREILELDTIEIDATNAVRLLCAALRFEAGELEARCQSFIIENFAHLEEIERDLQLLPLEVVQAIVDDDELVIEAEDEIFLAVRDIYTAHAGPATMSPTWNGARAYTPVVNESLEAVDSLWQLVRFAFVEPQNIASLGSNPELRGVSAATFSTAMIGSAANILYAKTGDIDAFIAMHVAESHHCDDSDMERRLRGDRGRGKISDSSLLDKEQVETLLGFFDTSPKKTNLLFRGTRDGFDASIFHQKCDSKGPTLTIVRSACGFLFGGFAAPKAWSSSGGYSYAPGSWLFSLTHPTVQGSHKLASTNSSNHLYFKTNYGPTFGDGHDLYISNNSSNGNGSYSCLGNEYSTLPRGISNFTSSEKFTVADYEVHQIIV